MAALGLHIAALWCVVIYNHLVSLPIALTGCEHNGTRPFEHRDEVGGDDGLCKEVLTGTEEGRALPFPGAVLDVEITAVTGPHAEMTVLQAMFYLEG